MLEIVFYILWGPRLYNLQALGHVTKKKIFAIFAKGSVKFPELNHNTQISFWTAEKQKG